MNTDTSNTNTDTFINYNGTEQPRYIFRQTPEILPEKYLRLLGTQAKRLYAAIWNRLAMRGLNSMWMTDAEVIRRSRINPAMIDEIRSELCRAGLMHIVPGAVQNKYEICDPDAEFEQMFPEPTETQD